LDKLADAQKAAHASGDAKAEAKTLSQIGDIYRAVSDFPKAMDNYNQALALARSANDEIEQAEALIGIARCYRGQLQEQKALEPFQQALDIATASGDEHDQAAAQIGIGNVHSNLGEKQEALEHFNQALTIERKAGERVFEALTLNNMGFAYFALGETQKALDCYEQALPIAKELHDGAREAGLLISIGDAWSNLGEREKELDYYNQGLAIFRQMGNRAGEANTLGSIGQAYVDLGERRKALEYYSQALQITRDAGNRGGEAAMLSGIGEVYSALGEKQKALESLNQALPIQVELKERGGEADTLNGIGLVYLDLGNTERALDYQNRALEIFRQLNNRYSVGWGLNNLGMVYFNLGDKQKALDYYNQELAIFRQLNFGLGQAKALNNIGGIYDALGDNQKALDYYRQAMPIFRKMNYPRGEANTLKNLGGIYTRLGDRQNAMDCYNEALALAAFVADPILESQTLIQLMWNQKPSQPGLAIFYGKQAINLLQQVRGNIQGLDEDLQKSFLVSKVGFYRGLANLLIEQGRLPEAEQVLDLVKQQEYSDFVRGEATDTLSPLTLTPAEREAEEEYKKSTAALVSMGEQWAQLKKNTSRTPEQDKQLEELSAQLSKAGTGLDDFYSRLYVLFGKTNSANDQVGDVKGNVSSLKQILAKMPHTVALYTLVGADRTSIIVITGSADVPAVVRESVITEADLNRKIAAFQEVLRHPRQDPRPLAQEMYQILIGPVKADLDQAEAKTLVWSLDGTLRYVPIAALYDGKQYVVENYNTATISPVSIAHLAEAPDMSNITTVAMGISEKYEEGLPALPAVVGELDDVVKDAKVQGANGALTGTILLNGQFTKKAMENQLGAQPTVVHIASHFVYNPGEADKSYLLLAANDKGGSADHLTVEDFHHDVNLSLSETALLTLSACETGMSGNASNGREVDGLGMTAESKGARAVISSLWSVNDASTGQLMGDFYQRWAEGAGRVTKVEALRQAQLDLLLGKARAGGDGGNRGVEAENTGDKPPATYAHPYYWAPFVLMGNWK
jgi:CHAT domain-containing protein/Tfp pilus assembly protein PilF